MKDIVIAIGGMSCGHCLNAVNRALAGIGQIKVTSVQMGRAELRVPEDAAVVAQVYAAIEDAGYKVEGVPPG
jgi:copper chaperone